MNITQESLYGFALIRWFGNYYNLAAEKLWTGALDSELWGKRIHVNHAARGIVEHFIRLTPDHNRIS